MALNIVINADYKLTSDAMNVIVNRKHEIDPTKSPRWAELEKKGADPSVRTEWREVAYCKTVDQAITWLMNRVVVESDATELREVAELITAFTHEIRAKLGR